MPLSLQQRADIYLHHWWNLWPLPAQERIQRMQQIVDDYEFEEQLALVAHEMELA
jgi:hypothetical protein